MASKQRTAQTVPTLDPRFTRPAESPSVVPPPQRRPVDRTAQVVHTSDGRQLWFSESGEPAGHPVFSLHGTPGGRRRKEDDSPNRGRENWLRSRGVRLVTYDRPGYGWSDRHPGRCVADAAADIATIADALGIDRFAVEGVSGGAPHALAAAALLGQRVLRVACVAPLAPYDELGHEEWSRGQDDASRRWTEVSVNREEHDAAALDLYEWEMWRLKALGKKPDVFGWRLNVDWGLSDDSVAHFKVWGFDCAAIAVPTAIWYDPAETRLPRQHAEWLARTIPNALLVTTDALGHGSAGDPGPDLARLYAWLIEPAG